MISIIILFIFTELISFSLYKKGRYKKTAIFSMFLFPAILVYTLLIILDIVDFGILFGGDPSNFYYLISLFVGIPLLLDELVLLVDEENKNLIIFRNILIFLNSFSSILLFWAFTIGIIALLFVICAYLFLIIPLLIINYTPKINNVLTNERKRLINYISPKKATIITVLIIAAVFLTNAIIKSSNFIIKDNTLITYKGNSRIVRVPNKVKTIERYAFEGEGGPTGDNVKVIVLPKNIRTIKPSAFSFTPADILVIKEGIKTLDTCAFAEAPYEYYLPKSITKIEGSIICNEEYSKGAIFHVVKGSYADKYIRGIKEKYEQEVLKNKENVDPYATDLGYLDIEGVEIKYDYNIGVLRYSLGF